MVSEKIGNPGDEGTDTLFGLLHPVNQPEEKADFYRYSTTDIKTRIQNWIPQSSGSRFYGKLTTFHAEKNGTLYVKIKSSGNGTFAFNIYDSAPYALRNAPEKTNLGKEIQGIMNDDIIFFHYQYSVNSNSMTKEWVIPVIAGIDYTFVYIGYSISSTKLEEFLLGYTDTVEA